ncbi:MAG: tRNA (adenosine(37)-N6)-threonylcarbamoyltransferase complex transferase subunit TsaD [Dongiaceae bacterium]
MIVLGIETSCDETAAAIVRDDRTILADLVLSQLADHRPYGGVVPEIAARSHLEHLDGLIDAAMRKAGVSYDALDGIAATGGPGLIGGVIVGVTMAKAIAAAAGKPFLAINHLEGHALSARLSDAIEFPYLLLLVSGGHCQFLMVEDVGRYKRLGTTLDDAAGEAFDKAAKLLGLGYPGGPAIERAAARATARGETGLGIDLPRPMKGRPAPDFSFSGLKTALRHLVAARGGGEAIDADWREAYALAFQNAVVETLADRSQAAIRVAMQGAQKPVAFVVAGGVAANRSVRTALAAVAERNGLRFVVPPLEHCTDNAAMIAWAGIEHLKRGKTSALDFAPRPRWPLDPDAPKRGGAGVKA